MRRERAITLSLLLGLSLVGLSLMLAHPPRSRAATTLTVNSTADDGTGTCTVSKCTLRDAILSAASSDTITFSLPANSTITLTNGELLINKNLTINGPGANLLTVQRSAASGTPQFRIFEIASFAAISGLTVANGNASGSNGGGIYNNGGSLFLTNSTISGNKATNDGGISLGGGIYNLGTLIITNSTISGNTAVNGGGIFNNGGTVTITNSTVAGNSGDFIGGGINNANGKVTITYSTISGNSAVNFGGGIVNFSTMTLTNSTISGNSAGFGGGVDHRDGTLTLRNTIIALNTSANAPDVDGKLTSQGFNLIGNNSSATITPTTGDQIGTPASPINPMLGQLQDNGGPTKTQALLSGSKAIDKGDSGGSSTDQRGFTRPIDTPAIANAGDGSDIGAYEVQPDQLVGCSEINLVVNNNSDGSAGSLRAVIASACGGSTITFAANVRGTIALTSGELLINKNLTISGPGANLLSVQRSAAGGTPAFRIFNIAANFNVAISGLTISNGSAPGNFGGGIFNDGSTVAITNSTVSGNTAASGGGIYNNGATLTITNSTISGNSGNGGGIFNDAGTVTITNSTISGNSAQFFGGGIFNFSTMTINSSTIAGNSAGSSGGGGVSNGSGTVNIRNTIIGLNTSASGPDVKGELKSEDFNLIGNSSGANISAQFSDQIGVTAAQLNLGPLQDNGGPTFTRALLSGSFAIDKGESFESKLTDQRGFARPVDLPSIPNAFDGDGGDIGAFEVQAQPTLQFSSATYSVNETAGSATITVTRANDPSVAATVNYATSDGTATAGADYTATSGTLSFASGDVSKTFTIPIINDSLNESNETVNLTLNNVTGNAALGTQSTAMLTIIDDDAPTIRFSASNYPVGEGAGRVDITVTRSGSISGASVGFATSDTAGALNCNVVGGVASARCDYETSIATLKFAAGETSKTISVFIIDDSYLEGTETFTVSLSNPTGAALASPSTATVTITDNEIANGVNPIDAAGFFVRLHYLDFLNREPDSSGLAFWTNEITSCGSDQACIALKRINVSAAFYISIEFQQTGYLVERIYKASYGDATGTSTLGGTHQLAVPVVRLNEFLQDTQQIGQGVIVNQTGWEIVLENNKVAFTNDFVQRSRFTTAFPASMTPAQFVDALNTNSGGALSTAERNQLVSDLTTNAKTRAQVLRAVAEDPDLNNAEFNRAFVLMQFFGYLRRNPNDAPDADYTGYDFWLTKLNQFNGNFVNAEMVKAFITSSEYRNRFGP